MSRNSNPELNPEGKTIGDEEKKLSPETLELGVQEVLAEGTGMVKEIATTATVCSQGRERKISGKSGQPFFMLWIRAATRCILPFCLTFLFPLSNCLYHPMVQDLLEDSTNKDNLLLALALIAPDEPFVVQSLNVGGEPTSIYCTADAIYIGGYDDLTSTQQWRLEKRSRLTGELDESFGNGGVINVDTAAGGDQLRDLDYDGIYIYIAGWDFQSGSNAWRLEKRLASTGELDPSFASNGVLSHDPSAGFPDYLHAIELAAGGIYLAGSSSVTGTAQEWRIEKRNLITGALDTGFNGTGIFTTGAGNGTQSRIFAMTVDDTYIYASGANQPGGDLNWRLDKRFLSDGSAESAFASGTVTDNAGSGAEEASIVLYDDSAVYLSGSDPDQHLQVNKYDRITGAPIVAFAPPDGEFVYDPSAGQDRLNAMLLVSNRLLFIGYDSANGSDLQWRISLRETSDGSLVSSFGTNGVIQSDPTSENDGANAACADASFVYVAGYEGSTNRSWRIEKRRLSDGSL
ncbi:MAG: hypothetical protein KDK23_06450 [Leptospiraceae bacterium]|nr:hypothetical protein [Leptospiraceae bacterium]